MNKIKEFCINVFFGIVDFISNVFAYLLKNINEIVGFVKSTVKVIVAIIHFWKPSADNWVDFVEAWGERIQLFLFELVETLNSVGKK